MEWRECSDLIRADVARLGNGDNPLAVVGAVLRNPSSRYLLVVRVAAWSRGDRRLLPIFAASRLLWRRWSVRYSLEVPYTAQISGGLRIHHLVGGIVVNSGAEIGRNCTLFHGTTIGARRVNGELVQSRIGDDVVVSPGASIVGALVGDRSFIASGAVVVRDVPADSTAAGVPAVCRPRKSKLSVALD